MHVLSVYYMSVWKKRDRSFCICVCACLCTVLGNWKYGSKETRYSWMVLRWCYKWALRRSWLMEEVKCSRGLCRDAIAVPLQNHLLWQWNEVFCHWVYNCNLLTLLSLSFSCVGVLLICISVPTLLTQNQSFVLVPKIMAVAVCSRLPDKGCAAVYKMSDFFFLCLFLVLI